MTWAHWLFGLGITIALAVVESYRHQLRSTGREDEL